MMGLFRSLIIIMMLMVIFTPQTTVKADPPVHESEYNWGNLRIDINNLNTVDDYRIQIKTTNYVPTTTNGSATFAFLNVWLSNTPGAETLQVGIGSWGGPFTWVAYTNGYGVHCTRGKPGWKEGNDYHGCIGDVGDLGIAPDTWVWFELEAVPGGKWSAVVVNPNNGFSYEVANFDRSSQSISGLSAASEESYGFVYDPHIPEYFYFNNPQYYSPGSGWQNWPKSDLSTTSTANKSNVTNSDWIGYQFCPQFYGINPNNNASSLSWYAGSGGVLCNDWTLLPPVLISGSIDDLNTSLIEYKNPSNWVHNSSLSPRAYQQSTSYSSVSGDSYSLTFYGTSISRMFAMHVSRGYVDVYIDGKYVGQVNDYVPLPARWEMVETWIVSPPGDHTIQLVAPSIAPGHYLDLDAFTVNASMALADTYDDQGRWQVIYIGNGWTHGCCYTGAYNQTASFSKTTEDAFEISFTGTRIFYYYPKASILGKAGIVMDGVDRGTIDQYASSTSWNNVWDSGALSNGPHTLHVVVTGTKNPSSTDYWIELDKLVVQ